MSWIVLNREDYCICCLIAVTPLRKTNDLIKKIELVIIHILVFFFLDLNFFLIFLNLAVLPRTKQQQPNTTREALAALCARVALFGVYDGHGGQHAVTKQPKLRLEIDCFVCIVGIFEKTFVFVYNQSRSVSKRKFSRSNEVIINANVKPMFFKIFKIF